MLQQASISGGVADLGKWGAVNLTGAASAVLQTSCAADTEFPVAVAEELPHSALVFNDDSGELLVLPYAGETVARITMRGSGDLAMVSVPRDVDVGMRLAALRVMPNEGVLFLTECSLLRFDLDLRLNYRVDDEFLGWEFDSVRAGRIELVLSDWAGNERRQNRDFADGKRID